MIAKLRMKQGIAQKDLCRGICSSQNLSKIELGEIIPEPRLLDCLWQRLGKSPDRFETILTNKEYQELAYRDKIQEKVLQMDYQGARGELLQYKDAYYKKGGIFRQYADVIEAVISQGENKNEESMEYFTKILVQFDLSLEYFDAKNLLLSTWEIEILLAISNLYFRVGNTPYAKDILQKVFLYLELHKIDDGELVKCYPKMIYLESLLYPEMLGTIQGLERIQRAFELLIQGNSTVFLGEVTSLLIRKYEALKLREKAKKLTEQFLCLQEVYERYGETLYVNQNSFCWFLESYTREYCLANELIKGERLVRKMSRSQTIEGIYQNEVSLARIEEGKQSPTEENFQLLMKKLGLECVKYNTCVVTNREQALREYDALVDYLSREDIENSKIEFEKVKMLLDLSHPVNQQFVELHGIQFDYILGQINEEDFCVLTEQALSRTFLLNSESNEIRIPTYVEAMIINQLAVSYRKQGKINKGLKLQERVLKCYDRSLMDVMHHHRSYGLIKANYIIFLEVMGMIDEAKRVCEAEIKNEMHSFKARQLELYLSELFCIEEREKDEKWATKNAENRLKPIFYICMFFDMKKSANAMKKYCEKITKKNFKWEEQT